MNARSRFLSRLLVPILAALAFAVPPLARAASPLCSSVGSNQNYEWVTRIAINGTSVAIPKTGYHDATGAALATLQAGQSYTVEVDVLTDGQVYLEYVKFWFDQNQNGAIEDPAELVFDQNASFASFRTFSGAINIPSSAYNGPMYVRMIMQYDASPALCGGYTYGTTVDLLVNVTGATANPTAPAAPTAVTAVAGNASATVSFTPSASSGVTGYTVTSSPGGITATGAGSPITVNGLTNGTTYTFTVSAQKSATVFSDPSGPSNAVTPQSVVNGACGAHHGSTLTMTPTALCSAGSASGVTAGTTDYTWSCAGSGGGSTASCAATRNYPVTTSVASGSGTISASQNVAYNATPAFTVTPNAGSVIQSVTGCGGSLSGNTYTAGPVTAACSVSATFIAQVNGACGADHGTSRLTAPSALCSAGSASAVTTGNASYDWSCAGTNGGSTASCAATRLYAVNSSVASGTGTISASQNVTYNATPSFTVTPGAGWVVQSVSGCGGSLSGSTYTTGAVTANCSVSATFVAIVNGTCGADHGTSSLAAPSAALCTAGTASAVVSGNASHDWSCAGANTGTTASCSATRLYAVSSSVASGTGTISASQNVAYNATPSFTVTPGAGWVVQSVSGCGGSLAGTTYTTGAVTANCSVSATFVAIVNGACGADHGTSAVAAPSAALCTAGTPSAVVSGNASHDWSCAGANTGTTASCAATRLYTVSTAVVGGQGSVSAPQNVAWNATPAVTVSPDPGWIIQSVAGCGGSLSGTTYTTGPVTGHCTVSATFVAIVNGACGAHHATAQVVAPTALCATGTASAVAAANTSWSWSCAGAHTGTDASCAAERHYRVTTSATAGGTIAATRDVNYNESPAFTVTPAAGHLVQSVSGCGGAFAGTPLAGGTYTAAPVTASCAIAATFVGNAPPAAGAVTIAGPNAVIRYGETLTGRYAYTDADGDAEDNGATGSAYRFVRSATATPPAPGQGQSVASGRTGGAPKTYVVATADVGQYLFYCVTPKAAAGDPTPGAEACSAATPAIQRATQAITLTPPPAVTLGTSGSVTLSGGPSSQPVTLVSTTPSVCTVNGLTVTAVGPGTCTLVATQGGDGSYETPTPVTITIAVDRLLPALALSAMPAMVDYRAPLTLVLDASGTFGRVDGEVAFLLDGTPIPGCAKVALDRGRAQCVTNRVPTGRHAALARFSGDTNYLGADSAPAAVLVKTVNPASRNRDTTGDGRTPIFFETPAGGLAILTSNDNAPMDGQQLLADGSGWRVVGFADFDGAGTADLVLRHADGRHQLWALDGIGIASRVDFTELARDAAIEAIADFDGDGKDDLLVKAADGSLAIWTMDGPIVKSRLPFAGAADGLAFLAVADLDADGGKDLVLATADGVRLQKLASGLAGAHVDLPWPIVGGRLAHLGDFDGDGRTDLVFEGPAGEAAILRLDGLAVPRRSDLAVPAGWRIVDVLDFDADFADDLVLEGPAGEISIATVGASLAITGTSAVPADAGWRLVQVADFDGDGGLDLLFASGAGELKSLRYRNGIFLGTVVLSHPTSWTVIP